jgi:hypothetical protein
MQLPQSREIVPIEYRDAHYPLPVIRCYPLYAARSTQLAHPVFKQPHGPAWARMGPHAMGPHGPAWAGWRARMGLDPRDPRGRGSAASCAIAFAFTPRCS